MRDKSEFEDLSGDIIDWHKFVLPNGEFTAGPNRPIPSMELFYWINGGNDRSFNSTYQFEYEHQDLGAQIVP